jgi:membrane protease YdiL (CAAX protease family)
MFFAFKAGIIREPTIPGWKLFFVYYVFISGPSQEFLFRSNFFALMRRENIGGPVLQIIASAVTYSFLHIFYNDLITLLVTFAAGLVWGWIYHRYPNFWGVAFSHSVLGAASIMVGLI